MLKLEATSAGYENTFVKDFNDDGLISGGSSYQLLGDNGPVDFYDFNDSTSKFWNVVAAKNNSSSFQVLFEGEASYEGKHNVWTTNANGRWLSETGWLTGAQATSAGYESVFNIDLNSDGIID